MHRTHSKEKIFCKIIYIKGFLQRILQEIMKENDTQNIRRLVDHPIDPVYHIEDCWISQLQRGLGSFVQSKFTVQCTMWSEFNSKRWSNSEKPVSGTSSFFYGERSSIKPNILLFAYFVSEQQPKSSGMVIGILEKSNRILIFLYLLISHDGIQLPIITVQERVHVITNVSYKT